MDSPFLPGVFEANAAETGQKRWKLELESVKQVVSVWFTCLNVEVSQGLIQISNTFIPTPCSQKLTFYMNTTKEQTSLERPPCVSTRKREVEIRAMRCATRCEVILRHVPFPPFSSKAGRKSIINFTPAKMPRLGSQSKNFQLLSHGWMDRSWIGDEKKVLCSSKVS